MFRTLLSAMLSFLMLLGCTKSGDDIASTEDNPGAGEVQVYGALRAMFHEGQTGTTVSLDSILPDPELYAVGALTELLGEVTVIGGNAYLSFSDGDDKAKTEISARPDADATLLVAVTVKDWDSYTIEQPIPYDSLDNEIARLAAAAGMDLEERIPFLLTGQFDELQWHVIDGSRLTDGGTSHQDHLAAASRMRLARTPATLIGFYSQSDQGVFTHMGSTTHIHCVVEEPLSSGHVDHVNIPGGTLIGFPTHQDGPGGDSSER